MSIVAIKRCLFVCLVSFFLFNGMNLSSISQFTKPNHFLNRSALIAMEPVTKLEHKASSQSPVKKDVTVRPIPLIQLGLKGDKELWLNEALATLHYLPVQFSPANQSAPSFISVLAAQVKTGNLVPFPGQWTWDAQYPASLTGLWDPDTATVITKGAILNFERQHNLAVDGIAGSIVFQELGEALTQNELNNNPYVYVTVTTSLPQRLDVWQDGHKAFTTLANTGISNSPTPSGTWPIYMRYASQTMTGKTPSGSTYVDKGVPFVSYFTGGCAIHGFSRSVYGSPQSLGCVELPIHSAQKVFSLLNYGTLVTIHS